MNEQNFQAYYSVLRNKLGGSTKALEAEPYSDYEAVDASSLFGRFKAKLRKSQMRKSSRSSASSAYFRPRMTLANHGDDIPGPYFGSSKFLMLVKQKRSC